MASSWETIVVGGQSMDVYLSLPDQPGPFPAVVVSQHGGGVAQFIREVADRLAAEGYAAAAPTVAAPYYGGNLMVAWRQGKKTPFDLAEGINCPVLFHFGEVDENPSQEDMRKLDDELTRLGKTHRFYTYPGADHAFMDYSAARYQKAASEVSWPRTLEFFSRHLKTST